MDKTSISSTETSIHTIETTLGDLIEAITEIALSSGRTEDEGYYLASVILNEILLPEAVYH